MAIRVTVSATGANVELSGLDRLVTWRRRVVFERSSIRGVRVANRADEERSIDHRVTGIGTHDGARRPNRRRVGTMLGRTAVGKQFWALPASDDASLPVLVLELAHGPFVRAVLAVDDPPAAAGALSRG